MNQSPMTPSFTIPVQLGTGMSPATIQTPITIPVQTQVSNPSLLSQSYVSIQRDNTMNGQMFQMPTFPETNAGRTGETCPQCGCRFVNMERHQLLHENINTRMSDTEGRRYYPSLNEWLSDTVGIENEDDKTVMDQEYTCALCGKKMQVIVKEGQTYLMDGVIQNGQIYHTNCAASL